MFSACPVLANRRWTRQGEGCDQNNASHPSAWKTCPANYVRFAYRGLRVSLVPPPNSAHPEGNRKW